MILEYDRSSAASQERKLQTLMESVQRALEDIETSVEELAKNGVAVQTVVDQEKPEEPAPSLYDVGDIYITVNPAMSTAEAVAARFGGTWEAFAVGKTLVGISSETEFNTIEKTGGSKTQSLTVANLPSHNHTGSTSSAGSHTHGVQGYERTTYKSSGARSVSYVKLSADPKSTSTPILSGGAHTHTVTIGSTGSGTAHNNLQPYITVYMWKKVAN